MNCTFAQMRRLKRSTLISDFREGMCMYVPLSPSSRKEYALFLTLVHGVCNNTVQYAVTHIRHPGFLDTTYL